MDLERATDGRREESRSRTDDGLVCSVRIVATGDCQVGVVSVLEESISKVRLTILTWKRITVQFHGAYQLFLGLVPHLSEYGWSTSRQDEQLVCPP